MHDASVHFLLVGDSADLPAMRATMPRLPAGAYGQIFIEVASPVQIQDWATPPGMTLTWLCRDRGRGGRIAPRGERASQAVFAWLAEWMPEDHSHEDLPYVLWIGCSTSERVDLLYEELAARIPESHLHNPHDYR